jgi:hypothetical protein
VQRTAFAVNPDPEESAPGYLTSDRLKQYLAPARVYFCHDATRIGETVHGLRKGRELWSMFLAIVLVALVAETYHANRREYRASAGP